MPKNGTRRTRRHQATAEMGSRLTVSTQKMVAAVRARLSRVSDPVTPGQSISARRGDNSLSVRFNSEDLFLYCQSAVTAAKQSTSDGRLQPCSRPSPCKVRYSRSLLCGSESLMSQPAAPRPVRTRWLPVNVGLCLATALGVALAFGTRLPTGDTAQADEKVN